MGARRRVFFKLSVVQRMCLYKQLLPYWFALQHKRDESIQSGSDPIGYVESSNFFKRNNIINIRRVLTYNAPNIILRLQIHPHSVFFFERKYHPLIDINSN